MRTRRTVEIVALIVVAVPNVLFGLGCILPGCGESDLPDAPAQVVADAEPPVPVEPVTGDTGDGGASCVTGEPSLELRRGGGPLPAEVHFRYGGTAPTCHAGDPGLAIGLAADGLLPGAITVDWAVDAAGDHLEGADVWDAACGAGGLALGSVGVDVPLAADGREVTVEVTLTDSAAVTAHDDGGGAGSRCERLVP